MLQKDALKFIIFLVNVIHIIQHNMLLTQHQLPFMCKICREFFIFQQNYILAH